MAVVQTLAKCSKMIPVMIWGMFIMGKRYKLKVRSLTRSLARSLTGSLTR